MVLITLRLPGSGAVTQGLSARSAMGVGHGRMGTYVCVFFLEAEVSTPEVALVVMCSMLLGRDIKFTEAVNKEVHK